MNPEEIRKDFPIFQEREIVYLDNAATSHKPRRVIDAIQNFYKENNANVGRGLYDLANDATREYMNARRTMGEFMGAAKDEVVFVRNTTEAENLLAQSLEFEGDIVLSEMAHHSEQLPWRRKAEEEGKEVKYLRTEEGEISLRHAKKKISEETGLVAISHVSNVFGAENPVKEIAEIAHENDALIVLDGAQSVPHMPVDVKELEVDFLCFSCHKMLGPSSIGVLYGRRELLEEMKPYQVGGGMIKSVKKESVEYSDPPGKFEAGTENVAGAVGLKAALEYLENIGMEEISEHDRKLARKLIEGLNRIEGVEVLSPEGANLASFTAEFAHPHDIAEFLNQEDVAVRAGNHCAQPQMKSLGLSGTVRASPYLYNTDKDVERFLNSVKVCREVFN